MGNRRDSSSKEEAAFVMGAGDRFHCILVSEGVHFAGKPGWETVLAFIVIRRAAGSFAIVSVVKTFNGEACVSRKVQTKEGIAAEAIERAMDAVTGAFSQAIEAASGEKLAWQALDLAQVADMPEQELRIAAWGKLRAWMEMPHPRGGGQASAG